MTRLLGTYDILLKRFGEQNWWPADSEFEVVIGAILTQSTSWKNVEKAIRNLKKKDVLNPEALYKIDVKNLSGLIRPAGYHNAKARKLKEFINYLHKNYEGNLSLMFQVPAENLRNELLSIWGIGPETADSIMLYAAGKPVFVVDAYTKRIFSRHGFVDGDIDYYGLKDFSEKNLPKDARVLNEFHALLVRLGKEHCRKTKPVCIGCPLEKQCKNKKTKISRKK